MSKRFLTMTLVLVFTVICMAPVGATVDGTKGTVVIDEKFEYADGTALSALGANWAAIKDLKTESTMSKDIQVQGGKLVIPAGEATDTENYGVRFTIGSAGASSDAYEWGTHPDNNRWKADEYVFEFDASVGVKTKLYLANGGNPYLTMENDGSNNGGFMFIENGSKASDLTNCIIFPNGEHHYKIVVKPRNYDAAENGNLIARGEKTEVKLLEIAVDVYVDGVCYVMDEVASTFTSSFGSRGITAFSILSTKSSCGETTIDNLEFYYLDGEARSDATTRFLSWNGGNTSRAYVTLFEGATEAAAKMNTEGSKLDVEVRLDGTQANAEDISVYLAQYSEDGQLKSVNVKKTTVAANETDKSTVTFASTAAEPLFANTAETDYLKAFVWTADGLIPLSVERTAGTKPIA